uniref:PDZ domain-containing protein n=1 Tax=Candidatus Kentrum eta TaxID=2126337 RepID=A0A450UM37_9GAMM|nr:MAG: PDZ domain-containing protein [Candidatus Kentron sp. H]VFJ94024.1 MAG: PDZ domain-containing protein [Candidatus Kentron sp. H]VFK01230.1 MAG: PDZ domain-containing protein [Candidatus Kentron sp. H]
MLELARMAGKRWPERAQPERAIVFVAFTGEEAGKIGSAYYVKNYRRYPAHRAIAFLNVDGVGRLGENPVTIFGTGTAREWPHLFHDVRFVTGVDIKAVPNDFGSGDQSRFIQVGVPSVHLFGSVHGDIHSPQDTVDKIDSTGLMKVAAVFEEAAEYLAARPKPLTATIAPVGAEGVRLADVLAESPAAGAGLRAGDIIVGIDGEGVADLAGFAGILRKLTPGDRVRVSFIRDGARRQVTLAVAAR